MSISSAQVDLGRGILKSFTDLLGECRIFEERLRRVEEVLPDSLPATDGIHALSHAFAVQNACLEPKSRFDSASASKLSRSGRQPARSGVRMRAVGAPSLPTAARAHGAHSALQKSAKGIPGSRSLQASIAAAKEPWATSSTCTPGHSNRTRRRNDDELMARLPTKYQNKQALMVLRRMRTLVAEASDTGITLAGARDAMQMLAEDLDGSSRVVGRRSGKDVLVQPRMSLSQASSAMDLLLRMGWAERRSPEGKGKRGTGAAGLVYILAGPPRRGRVTAGKA